MDTQPGTRFTDITIEEVTIVTVMYSRECAQAMQQRLNVINGQYSLFSNDNLELLNQIILQFYHRYGVAPQPESLAVLLNSETMPLLTVAKRLAQHHNPQPDNFSAMLDRLTELAILRTAADHLLQCADEMEREKVDGIEQLVRKLHHVINTRSTGQSVIEASDWQEQKWVEDYIKYHRKPDLYRIKLALGPLSERIGTVTYGEMVSLYGGVNQGKSFLLGHLAWNLFYNNGLHVVHVTLETSKRFVEWRYTARALKEIFGQTLVSFNDFRNGTITPKQLRWIAELTSPTILGTQGSLFIMDIPEEYANVTILPALLNEFRPDKPTDVIVIDYATLMRLQGHQNGKNPLEWDVIGLLSKELREQLARSRTITNSSGEKGTILLTASQTNPQHSMKRSVQHFIKNVQATDVGLSYLYSQPVDVGIHLRREHDATFWEKTQQNQPPPPDLLLLVLTKSRHTGGTGYHCWFRPDWENWDLGPAVKPDELIDQMPADEVII